MTFLFFSEAHLRLQHPTFNQKSNLDSQMLDKIIALTLFHIIVTLGLIQGEF